MFEPDKFIPSLLKMWLLWFSVVKIVIENWVLLAEIEMLLLCNVLFFLLRYILIYTWEFKGLIKTSYHLFFFLTFKNCFTCCCLNLSCLVMYLTSVATLHSLQLYIYLQNKLCPSWNFHGIQHKNWIILVVDSLKDMT